MGYTIDMPSTEKEKRYAKDRYENNKDYFRQYYVDNKERQKEDRRLIRDKNRKLARDFVKAYLIEHPCMNCGEKDILTLEFDHRDPSTKTYTIRKMIEDRRNSSAIAEEIAKCDVLCGNCHRRRTAAQFGSYRAIIESVEPLEFQVSLKDTQSKELMLLERQRENRNRSRSRIREFIRNFLLIHPCIDCGENDIVVLEFDHKDPICKLHSISEMIVNRTSLEKLAGEISKCDIRCVNCHKKRTHSQFGGYRDSI